MMPDPKPGEIITDGKNVNIGAPVVKAIAPGPQTPADAMKVALRHLKGVTAAFEDLQHLMEKEEKEK